MRRTPFVAFLLIASLFSISCEPKPELPVLFTVPDETLTNDGGQPVSLAAFHGKATVYAFIFTRCAGVCPTMMISMKSLAAEVSRDAQVRYALISVDPDYDTAAVLRDYRKKHGVGDAWVFLTGTREQISKLSIEGFKLAAPKGGGGPDEPIVHSTKFVLVDKQGRIRAYYDSFDAEQLTTLRRGLVALAKE
jgi:protein SCO1/2